MPFGVGDRLKRFPARNYTSQNHLHTKFKRRSIPLTFDMTLSLFNFLKIDKPNRTYPASPPKANLTYFGVVFACS